MVPGEQAVEQVVDTVEDPRGIKATTATAANHKATAIAMEVTKMDMEATKADTVEDSSHSHRVVEMAVAIPSPTRTKVATTRTTAAVTGEAMLETTAVAVVMVVLAEATMVSVTLPKLTEELILIRATRACPTQHQILLSQHQLTPMLDLSVNNKSHLQWKVVQLEPLQAQQRSSPTISVIQSLKTLLRTSLVKQRSVQ